MAASDNTKGEQVALGKRIREQRLNQNMTQTELADMLDLSVGAISQYERGVCGPRRAILPRLCNALRIDMTKLMTGK